GVCLLVVCGVVVGVVVCGVGFGWCVLVVGFFVCVCGVVVVCVFVFVVGGVFVCVFWLCGVLGVFVGFWVVLVFVVLGFGVVFQLVV
ncbi:hypothetical protein DVA80_20965, partial [Acinetobacter baumannii]|uniref:hypothetical protein n=1 Tax=Acinetobacter baumannii TaxID=470 RepID=UPI000E06927E